MFFEKLLIAYERIKNIPNKNKRNVRYWQPLVEGRFYSQVKERLAFVVISGVNGQRIRSREERRHCKAEMWYKWEAEIQPTYQLMMAEGHF